MSQHVGHCPNCKSENVFDASALVLRASRLQCFWCGIVEDAAAYQLSQPGVSQEAKTFWGLVGFGAVAFGLFALADHLSS